MYRYILLLLVLVVSVLSVQAVFARPSVRFDESTQTCRNLAVPPLDRESRPWGEGGKGFKNICQKCHSRKNTQNIPFLWVESKTSKAWNRVFTQRYPKCAKGGVWDAIEPEKLQRINDYLYRFSADSRDLFDNC